MSRSQLVELPLRALVPNSSNPRKRKATPEAHRQLVASIATLGLIHPLVVRKQGKQYIVIAGNRRLTALRELHANTDVKVPCLVREVEALEADAISLGENFAREPMHPLDEAIAFAQQAQAKGKTAEVIASEFGVAPRYVLQRMKLANLARPVADAYRKDAIDTATAEAFASVPASSQVAIYKDLDPQSHNARTVRAIIENAWIPMSRAIFDVSTVPPQSISADLFGDEVLIERKAFMDRQSDAAQDRVIVLAASGYVSAVVGTRDQIRDQLYSMEKAKPEYDREVTKKLEVLGRKRREFEKQLGKMKFTHPRRAAIESKLGAVETTMKSITAATPVRHTEATKAKTKAFLIVEPDGSVVEEFRIIRSDASPESGGSQSQALTVDDLSDSQIAEALAAHGLAVRDALMQSLHLQKVLLVLMLHPAITSTGLAIRSETNSTSQFADRTEGFCSSHLADRLRLWKELDPFHGKSHVDDVEAFARLNELPDKRLDQLISFLAVERLTHGAIQTSRLALAVAKHLNVTLREHWTPGAQWLRRYRRNQLQQLAKQLGGKAQEVEKKHGELASELADLFAKSSATSAFPNVRSDRVTAWTPKPLQFFQ